ncbi:MAG TPA: glutamate--tRNA ligase, partial [Candidatus Paceibacterota bacterium]|nr:glutamate--tRNA ligase [Candidatus Paceibacterota bacterium]
MSPNPVVTRFAPSPTGFLHVGGVRTALFAWLYARKHHGTFILRIEDTDKEREVAGSIEHIQESLTWLGLTWDQGPIKQSERLDTYRAWAQKLIDKGLAYPDPYTESEVEQFRQEAEAQKKPFLYRDHRPATTGAWDGTKPLRFKVPEIKRYTWQDIVRGELTAGEEALDDFILIKSDGYPTYNFAHIVDDIEMGVTHVMRGEEFIASTPKFLALYEALGETPPHFATMPVILGPDGHKKLSKRDGAKDILDYRKEGYLPEAMVNFLALLGWHPEGEQEVFSVDELIKAFEIERVQKGGAKFDEAKLLWLNHEHIKRLSDEQFAKLFETVIGKQGLISPTELRIFSQIHSVLKERTRTLLEPLELIKAGEFDFMGDTISYDKELLLQGAKAEAGDVAIYLARVAEILEHLDEPFTAESVKEAIFPYATEVGRAGVLWPMRIALSGKEKSPDPFTLAGLLGRDKTLARL